jgi:hypothetical protein
MSAASPDEPFTIFISYSKLSDPLCYAVRTQLEALPGVRVAVDIKLLQGDDEDWRSTLLDEVAESDLLVALLSKRARESYVVREELSVAREWVVPILAVYPDLPQSEIPPQVRNANRISLDLDSPERNFTDTLVAEVKKRVVEIRANNLYFAEKRAIRLASRKITATLRELPQRSPSLDFQLRGIKDPSEAAADEAERQVHRKVGQADSLSVDNSFLIRALPSFSTAEKIYAVSHDLVSRFWGSGIQAESAQKYLTSQTGTRICRLFVFSDPWSAHNLRHVLAAHHRQYGSRDPGGEAGGVFLCPEPVYRTQLVPEFLKGERGVRRDKLAGEFETTDFGILEYTADPRSAAAGRSEYYKLQLTGPQFLRTYLGERLEAYQQQVIDVFERLRLCTPGHAERQSGVLRWADEFATDNGRWAQALMGLFPGGGDRTSPAAGRVIHMVFFHRSVDRNQLMKAFHDQYAKIRVSSGTQRAPLVEDLFFSINTRDMLGRDILDGQFRGKLNIDRWFVEQYPFALFTTLRSVADLIRHYESVPHSEARESILRALDPRIGKCYSKIHASTDPAERKFYYESAEAYASALMHRIDYQQHDDISMIVDMMAPHDEGWRELWEATLKDRRPY